MNKTTETVGIDGRFAPTITPADRAIARRVLRRHVGAGPNARIKVWDVRGYCLELRPAYVGVNLSWNRAPKVGVGAAVLSAAEQGAALGRMYAAALRGAR